MRRRQVLIGVGAAAAVGGLAGSLRDESETTDSEGDAPTLAAAGLPETICAAEPEANPGIYAIDESAFGTDWKGHTIGDRYANDSRMGENWTVIGIEYSGHARAYAVPVLWYHEVVNDEFGGPVLITYCQICRSGGGCPAAGRRITGPIRGVGTALGASSRVHKRERRERPRLRRRGAGRRVRPDIQQRQPRAA